MCGFVGYWEPQHNRSHTDNISILEKMSQAMFTRGPDGGNAWFDERFGIGLGHRRLKILDLSEDGQQPMHSANPRYSLVYNGEIYNYLELRRELEQAGICFQSDCDTEVLLAACQVWGVEQALSRFVGMFAFALWDATLERLTLARDRLGIKPLYWGIHNGILLFGSTLAGFCHHPKWRPQIDQNALAAFFKYNYVPGTFSIFEKINKVAPATLIHINKRLEAHTVRYWYLEEVVARGIELQGQCHPDRCLQDLREVLQQAIELRMRADVPLGAFLSGGVDSSLVCALMQDQAKRPINTFSIGFADPRYDESDYARAVANHLGTCHHDLICTPRDALDLIPNLAHIYDEPFADSSQLPTLLVCRMAKEKVTVALSGDGGDELFAGYNRYVFAANIWNKIRFVPKAVRKMTAFGITQISPQTWDQIARWVPGFNHRQLVGDKAHKLAKVLQFTQGPSFYEHLVSCWDPAAESLQQADVDNLSLNRFVPTLGNLALFEWMQYADILTYLHGDILTKLDRASMAYGLEARVPLLDHRVVELAWRLPRQLKLQGRTSKYLLRQLLYQYVPKPLIERPKMGFGVPIGDWLRGDLRPWAEDLLQPQKLEASGLNPTPILQHWSEHRHGLRNWQAKLWGVLSYQAWYEQWGP